MKRILNYIFLLVAIVVSVLLFMESRQATSSAPQGGPGAKSPVAEAPQVWVQEVAEKRINPTHEYVGRVEAIDSVNLVARVSGYLETIDFVEGAWVEAGDRMFTIEQDRFLAEIESRKGAIAQIEANIVEAEKFLQRLKSAKKESVPEKDIEAAQRDVDYFSAQLISAKAALALAKIDLEYTTVKAPMSGRITKKHYSVGDYVGPNSGTIATIVQFDPIRVVCSMSEVEYLDLMEQSGASPQNKFRPTLKLPNGSGYAESGAWDFADTEIDSSTGTISLRSRYPNPKGMLIPGGYVTVVLSAIKGDTLPLVPQAAVMESQEGSYVFVVGENNIAEKRIVRKRTTLGMDWIIDEGIRAGESVIVEGVQKVRPGQAVSPSDIAMKAARETGGR